MVASLVATSSIPRRSPVQLHTLVRRQRGQRHIDVPNQGPPELHFCLAVLPHGRVHGAINLIPSIFTEAHGQGMRQAFGEAEAVGQA